MIQQMRRCQRVAMLGVLFGFFASAGAVRAADENIPRLRNQNSTTQLVVDGKPFLILGVSVSDSSTTTPDAIAAIWSGATRLNANTVLAPVSQKVIEPAAGQVDFTTVDLLIQGALANKLHLIVQWSGDAQAFAALMKHVAQSDASHVVIAVQLGAASDDAGKIAAAGKAEYGIPIYGDFPGIDVISSDIHSPNFAAECARFSAGGKPLFIANAEASPTGVADFLCAIGKFNAIGVAVAMPADSADRTIPAAYSAIAGLAPVILDNQGKDTLYAFAFGPGSPDEKAQDAAVKTDQFTLTVHAVPPAPAAGRGNRAGGGFGNRGGNPAIGTSTTTAGIIIAVKPNEFLVLHSGLGISVTPNDPSLGELALGFQETGSFVDGKWKRYQRTNGDENDHDRRIDGAMNGRWQGLHVAYYQRP